MVVESRQHELVDDAKLDLIDVVGLGMHGSWTALALARLGFPLRVWDADVVGLENLETQAYRRVDVGHSKVSALTSILESHGYEHDVGLLAHSAPTTPVAWDGFIPLAPIVVSCVDSLHTRQRLAMAAMMSKSRMFIESRSAAHKLFIHSFEPTEENTYNYLSKYFPQQVAEVTCGMTGTTAMGMQVAAIIAGLVMRTKGGVDVGLYPAHHEVNLGLYHTSKAS